MSKLQNGIEIQCLLAILVISGSWLAGPWLGSAGLPRSKQIAKMLEHHWEYLLLSPILQSFTRGSVRIPPPPFPPPSFSPLRFRFPPPPLILARPVEIPAAARSNFLIPGKVRNIIKLPSPVSSPPPDSGPLGGLQLRFPGGIRTDPLVARRQARPISLPPGFSFPRSFPFTGGGGRFMWRRFTRR